MSTIVVLAYGVGRQLLCKLNIHDAKDFDEAVQLATGAVLQVGEISAEDIVTMEIGSVVYNKYIFAIQIWSPKDNSEYIVDGSG